MPYIKQRSRDYLDESIEDVSRKITIELLGNRSGTAGVLNYTISKLIMKTYQDMNGDLSYAQINEIMGVLECIKQELYRRSFGPYEDEAKRRNNDLYEFMQWG